MSNDQPAKRPVGKANDPHAGVKAPAPASTPAKKQETLVNGDDGISTEPKSLVGQSPISRTLGRYTILSELGRGGMGGCLSGRRQCPEAESGVEDPAV